MDQWTNSIDLDKFNLSYSYYPSLDDHIHKRSTWLDAQSWMKNVKTLFKIANIVVASLHM